MTKILAPLLLLAFTNGPPAAEVSPKACEELKDSHVLIRQDIADRLSADSKKLEICEEHLTKSQVNMGKLDGHIKAIDNTVQVYGLREKMLNDHITKLETMIQRQSDYIQQLEANQIAGGFSFAKGWEEVDGAVGLFAGYALGTGTCVGMAYVFNQPAFGGQVP